MNRTMLLVIFIAGQPPMFTPWTLAPSMINPSITRPVRVAPPTDGRTPKFVVLICSGESARPPVILM